MKPYSNSDYFPDEPRELTFKFRELRSRRKKRSIALEVIESVDQSPKRLRTVEFNPFDKFDLNVSSDRGHVSKFFSDSAQVLFEYNLAFFNIGKAFRNPNSSLQTSPNTQEQPPKLLASTIPFANPWINTQTDHASLRNPMPSPGAFWPNAHSPAIPTTPLVTSSGKYSYNVNLSDNGLGRISNGTGQASKSLNTSVTGTESSSGLGSCGSSVSKISSLI